MARKIGTSPFKQRTETAVSICDGKCLVRIDGPGVKVTQYSGKIRNGGTERLVFLKRMRGAVAATMQTHRLSQLESISKRIDREIARQEVRLKVKFIVTESLKKNLG